MMSSSCLVWWTDFGGLELDERKKDVCVGINNNDLAWNTIQSMVLWSEVKMRYLGLLQ